MEQITRQIFWNMQGEGVGIVQILTYILILSTFIILGVSMYKGAFGMRLRMIKAARGGEIDRLDNKLQRLIYTVLDIFTHRKILREPYQGIFHACIFLGFVILFIGTSLVFIQADIIHPLFHYNFLKGDFYLAFSFITDAGGCLLILGLLLALFRRYVIKPAWLDQKPEDLLILWLILVIAITGFLIEGLRMASTELRPGDPMQAHAWFSFAGYLVALPLSALSIPALKAAHYMVWWTHVALVLVFFVYLGHSKLMHIFTIPMNIFMRHTSVQPPLKIMSPELLDTAETFGVHTVEEYSWKDLFDQEACVRCGRCVEVCPAFNTDKPLKPRDVIQDIRAHMEQKAKFALGSDGKMRILTDDEYTGPPLIEGCIAKDTIWSCTTCMACVEACPAYILQFPKLIELRRYLTMMESDFSDDVQNAFNSFEEKSNPWGLSNYNRADWAKNIETTLADGGKEKVEVPLMADTGGAEYLFYVGCAGSLDDRNKRVAMALAKLFNAAGLDWAILGTEEGCCGDSAKKLGNEYVYQALAMANIETFDGYGVKKIITMCPHGYNTIKHDYKELGGNYEVYHYTEILDTLIQEDKLKPAKPVEGLGSLTVHDSCYLGRYNHVYDQPRNIVQSLRSGNLVEMSGHHAKSFCCGAGGGRMWMEENLGTRINQKRTQQIVDSGAQTVCTACPFCLTMLSDGIKELGQEDKLKSYDIAELTAKALGLD